MKKLIFIMLSAVILVFLGSASALAYTYGIGVGDQVVVTAYNHAIGGGEFAMLADNGYEWTSFCVEKEEHIWPGNYDYVGGLSFNAVQGGVNTGGEIGYDPLSDKAAWLYWSFWKDTLPNYDSTKEADQTSLQRAIWYLEEEIDSYADPQGWLLLAGAAVDPQGEGWKNDGKVLVANLYQSWDEDDGYFGYMQDVLVPGIPEPATMLLLGTGLIGLAFLGRKKLFKK